jgi:threonine synthase
MAQTAYYVWATASLGEIDVAVPTGNFGNVLAAWFARRAGAPIARLVVGTNANHVMADVIDTGRITLGEVHATLAPAMDIQISSNFERYLFELFDHDGGAVTRFMSDLRTHRHMTIDEVHLARIEEVFAADWSDDGRIEATIAAVYERHGVLIDPHTAAGWAAAETHASSDREMVVVSTAHPAKFPDAVQAATGVRPELPPDLADLFEREERTGTIDPTLEALSALLSR